MTAAEATCPRCQRPLVSREEWEAMPDGTPIDFSRCYANVTDDDVAMCHSTERRNRAKADAAILADARCFPAGYLAEVAAILRAGAKRHGVEPHQTGGGQGVDDHLQHALDHLLVADNDLSKPGATVANVDPDSGRSQFAHAGARSALGWECERVARLVLAAGSEQ